MSTKRKFLGWFSSADKRADLSQETEKPEGSVEGVLSGQTALVVGASGNIGSAITRTLANRGANVIVHYHQNRRAAEALAEGLAGQRSIAHVVQADIRSMDEVQRLTDEAINRFGQIDILVNNAGMVKDKLLIMMSDSNWNEVMDVNLTGTFNCCKCVTPHMKARRYGRIVNIGSITGIVPQKLRSNYGTSKRAMYGLTKCLARELASFNITVNIIVPQVVEGGLSRHASRQELAAIAQITPVGGLANAQDVAYAVAFLAGDETRFITGTAVNITGGLVTWQL